MTKEQASLQELGLSEAQLAERQDRVKQLISMGTTHPASMADLSETAPTSFQDALQKSLVAPKPPKKPRSDKGIKRVKPAPAPASGKLSKEDMSRWRDLMATVSGRRTEMDQAIARFEAAEEELDAWIADHTA